MFDAALDGAETFAGFAWSQGEPDSAASIIRLNEIRNEMREAIANKDVVSVANLVSGKWEHHCEGSCYQD